MFNKSTTDDARKAREENEEFVSNLEQDYKTRISELLSRIDGLQKENGKLKSELGPFKDRYRNLESEYNTLIRRLEEKGISNFTIKNVAPFKHYIFTFRFSNQIQ